MEMRHLIGAEDLEWRERVLERSIDERPALGCRRFGRARATTSTLPCRFLHLVLLLVGDSPHPTGATPGYDAMSKNGSPSASRSTSIPRP